MKLCTLNILCLEVWWGKVGLHCRSVPNLQSTVWNEIDSDHKVVEITGVCDV